MSVRPDFFAEAPALSCEDGELVSVHVSVEPRLLEKLLDALADLSFPVNPQIYHHAGIGFVSPGGSERLEPCTIVEFPAFSSQLDEVREILSGRDLPPGTTHVRGMLEDIQRESWTEAAPAGSGYAALRFYHHVPSAG